MLTGALIVESLQPATVLDDVPLHVTKIVRRSSTEATFGQPQVWTDLEFTAEDDDAELLAQSLAAALDGPGWWADFRSDSESFVIFPGRVFRYARGDSAARLEAQEYGRQIAGVPEHQLDWAV